MLAKPEKNIRGSADRIYDPKATRSLIEDFMTKSFDPQNLPEGQLDKTEAARYITQQTRKLRILAGRSGNPALAWMLENAFYQAYAAACPKQSEIEYKIPPIS